MNGWYVLHERGSYFINMWFDIPCPAGDTCTRGGDKWEGVFPCEQCCGNGRKQWIESRTVRYLWVNLAIAMSLEKAFQEGYSAGVTDALRTK